MKSSLLLKFLLWLCCIVQVFGNLRGISEDELRSRFVEFEIIEPTVVTATGQYISHDVTNARRHTEEHIARRRNKRSVEDTVIVTSHRRNSRPFFSVAKSDKNRNITLLDMTSGNTTSQEHLHFNLTVFGESLKLRVRSKSHLISPRAKSVLFTSGGGRVERKLDPGCVFTGEIPQLPHSNVAISNCDGLAGLIRTPDDEIFIEPIEDRHVTGPQKHVIYRRSATKNSANHGQRMEALKPTKRDDTRDSMQGSLEVILEQTKRERSKRHAKRNDYNMEILLTVGHEIVRVHGRHHVENYLVTLMNIVDEIYHDDSLGEHINIILTRIYQLDAVRTNNLIVENEPKTSLNNVCHWAKDIQVTDPAPNGRTYDAAIFLTRIRFGTAGYAHVDGLCQPLRSCSLTYEDGFSSAFVVAHETGHILGMKHDGDFNRCGDETTMGSIMAPLVQAAFHRYHWSRCSQEELRSSLGSYTCLSDDPHLQDWGPTPLYPGVAYSVDDQCRFDFGRGYKRCTSLQNIDVCKTLWCSNDENPDICKTKKGPAVDGTECGDNMWCFKGHCVWRDQRQTAVDGNWGSWNTYGQCSRSCGTGVWYRTRMCNNPMPSHGGVDCIGQNIDFDLCSKRPCPNGRDFREEQCQYQKEVLYKGQKHKWFPYEPRDASLKCELYCVSKRTHDIVSMGDIVGDGTRCSYEDPHGICVRGECVDIGCDKVIGSSMREDVCGVCGGNGQHCRNINGVLNKRANRKVNNYMRLYKIPAGARRINIRETSSSSSFNLLALKSRQGRRYTLNSRSYRIQTRDTPHKFVSAGTLWHYDVINGLESITAYGPTNSDVILLISVQRRASRVSVAYSYVMHVNSLPRSHETFRYAVKRWTVCSVTCGAGTKRARYGCRSSRNGGRWVSKRNCNGRPPRPEKKICSTTCTVTTRWFATPWSACSKTCGNNGFHTRAVTCRQINPDATTQLVSAAMCFGQVKLPTQKTCTVSPCPPKWRTGAWTKCSKTCGEGIQQRRVICRSSNHSLTSNHECPQPQPPDVRECQLVACSAPAVQSTETCVKERWLFCRYGIQHCGIREYQKLCCLSCHNYTGVAGQPAFSRPLSVAVQLSPLLRVNSTDDVIIPLVTSLPTPITDDDVTESNLEPTEFPPDDVIGADDIINIGDMEDMYYDETSEYIESEDVLKEYVDTMPPSSDHVDTMPPSSVATTIATQTEQLPLNVGFRQLSIPRNISRQRRSMMSQSIHRGWGGCMAPPCGVGRRFPVFGCLDVMSQSWLMTSSCRHKTISSTVCVQPCYYTRRTKDPRKLDCRKRGRGPRVPLRRCRFKNKEISWNDVTRGVVGT
nr:A disintegrin and metalloproteinase with thrombospondin motifs 3 isoform X1 [Ciona intestinalis]|eukprot:XP_018671182.1 A disintegrin and metalloproteinase with thrombospondin motifs 3 isoform X1 [Ciona intestinalis]